jgi:hypothetical protein
MCRSALNLIARFCDQMMKRPRQRLFNRGRGMTRTIFGSISAVALAALIAGAITILPSFSEQVAASTSVRSDHVTAPATPIRDIKADRLDSRPLGSQCSEQAWPYFEAKCLRNPRAEFGQVKAARIVSADRR